MMLHIGCHLSVAKGFLAMGEEALSIGGNTFAFFTRNPRGSKAKPIDPGDAAALMALLGEHQFAPLVAHAPYTMNLCSASEETRQFAAETLADDLRRMAFLPGQYYNFHPGSHVGQGVEKGTAQIANALNQALTADQTTIVLLETMAGKGTEIGKTFEELAAIRALVHHKEKVGICLDTCHVNDGGYDIKNNLDQVLEEFDRIIGLKHLKAIHLNDSLNPLASHKDRHAKIGEGSLGIEAIQKIINHKALRHLPFVLETPNELPGYAAEIALLRGL